MSVVRICKIFTFDAAHQLTGHTGKCANLHGHTYTLEVVIAGEPHGPLHPSDEGFVMDFAQLKSVVKEKIVDVFDHAFLAMGNEAAIDTLRLSGSKVTILGFRTTAENMALYICHELREAGLPIHSVKLWETQTSWAEVYAADIPPQGPKYGAEGACDVE
ncbi:6-carboxytetrahydropterin synthase QueD [Alicyclobacillus curvatus]|jgi:6-pyruvoyltetrahydropterin/6-carboxytetrahydropterin synthase|nr:6-carboxytetrahydropterin synthase QueD [Alicyclobacillus curvatus]